LPTNKPIIYLTLGSSGQSLLLPKLFDALSELPVTVLAATMRTYTKRAHPLNTYIADYLPGLEAAARAKLVICNGGSLTCQQALAVGVPVLGIASNMDQFLNMEALTKAGLARMLRADRLSVGKIRSVVTTMISCPRFTRTAEKFSSDNIRFKAQRTFAAFVDKIMGEQHST
jgi:UDP:flavonoid glycosyltransferase YjiC (YdhE family)